MKLYSSSRQRKKIVISVKEMQATKSLKIYQVSPKTLEYH